MKQQIGFLGVGHLAHYMIEGLLAVDAPYDIHLFNRTAEKAKMLAERHTQLCVHDTAQSLVDHVDLLVLATRPNDAQSALANCQFSQDQIVLSVAAGVGLSDLQIWSAPAKVVRSLPLACVRTNSSPTACFPKNNEAIRLLEYLGPVHLLDDEDQFAASSALTGALFAWLFPLLDTAAQWGEKQGLPAEQARAMTVETFIGAGHLAQSESTRTLDEIWLSLATPGGISEQGQTIITERGGLEAYEAALDAVKTRMSASVAE